MTTRQVVDHQLRSHPFMRGMDETDIARIVQHGRLVEFEARDRIFAEGELADAFYLIRTGLVALRVVDGGASRKIETLHEGDALGWSWLFPPYEWHFEAVAETPVRAIAVDAGALRREFEADPGFGYRLIARIAEVMAKRLYATRRHVLNLMGY